MALSKARKTTEGDTPLDVEQKKKLNSTKRLPNAQHPVEIEYWYVLPAVRREFAIQLKAVGNLRQKDVANILGITEAAVSQYLKGTRGVLELRSGLNLELPSWLRDEVGVSCETVLEDVEDRHTYLREVNRIITLIRDHPRDFLCKLHSEFGTAEEGCTVCFEI